MFDVHPPHSPIHGWRDFLIQLCTITVGLLIALALEGLVEWLHHRHVMHEAQASLYLEIKNNSNKMQSTLDRLHSQQAALRSDVVILKKWIAHPEVEIHDSIDITFAIKSFESVSWKTAQATGALALMPYDVAQQYADIYAAQDEIELAERQAARDTTTALGYLLNVSENDPNPSREEATLIKRQIETLQGQLLLVDTFLTKMDLAYKNYLQLHRDD